jgi:hypothetical protein
MECIAVGTAIECQAPKKPLAIARYLKGMKTLLIARLKTMIRRLNETDGEQNSSDPLSHPAIRAMSARELADLPLPPLRRK